MQHERIRCGKRQTIVLRATWVRLWTIQVWGCLGDAGPAYMYCRGAGVGAACPRAALCYFDEEGDSASRSIYVCSTSCKSSYSHPAVPAPCSTFKARTATSKGEPHRICLRVRAHGTRLGEEGMMCERLCLVESGRYCQGT